MTKNTGITGTTATGTKENFIGLKKDTVGIMIATTVVTTGGGEMNPGVSVTKGMTVMTGIHGTSGN